MFDSDGLVQVDSLQVDAKEPDSSVVLDERCDTTDISGATSTDFGELSRGSFVDTSIDGGGVGRKVIAMAAMHACMYDFLPVAPVPFFSLRSSSRPPSVLLSFLPHDGV